MSVKRGLISLFRWWLLVGSIIDLAFLMTKHPDLAGGIVLGVLVIVFSIMFFMAGYGS